MSMIRMQIERTKGMISLERKTVLITGGGRNIGLEIAKVFAERGYDIAITGRDAGKTGDAAADLEKAYPGARVSGYALELSNMDSVRALVSRLETEMPRIDVLVCNAGHLGVDLDIYTTTEADYDAVFDTNVKGNFFLIQGISKGMMHTKRGSIVLMSSVQSKGAVEGRTVYGATKGALNVLNKYLAYDLAPYGIRVNAVVLGAVHTQRWDDLPEAVCKERRRAYPLGREASGKEVGDAVLFFAEDTSASITGTEICVDSGLLVGIQSYKERKKHI